ncbi:cellulase family glycosylhydrolase [Paenibacillus sp. LHD-38]|uniref:glycoside hydrolase family 5 protein n=1 Tax=Paenibacillus sp. LHD-38 TaxID=3072143 RepID=UPI00280EB1ED|nr:cellulase family glycosylhydrolase [Paenibacillus sp. LHD-38]MDQ8736460.1 cellulase family glycosylhydrolase [Paenibacillus sp. LHD-38]
MTLHLDKFVQVSGEDFKVNGEKIVFRGFGLGSWMNLEHFMIGLPGTDTMIKNAFAEVYGEERSHAFFDRFLLEFVDEKDFEFLKKIGVNSLRIPFNYKYFIDDQHPNHYKNEGFAYLDHIVALCEKYEIYAILDLHSVPGGQNPDWHCDTNSGLPLFWEYGALRDSVIGLWGHIAHYYKDQPWIAAYDIVNEPSMVTNANVFNEFYDKVITEIRKYDQHHIIFIEGNKFTTDFTMIDPIDDPQVAYEFHFYPFVDEPAVLTPEMDRARRIEIFKDAFEQLVSIREKYKRPLWCGELGLVFEKEQIDFQMTIIEDMLDLCEANDVSWALWTYKDAATMGIVYPREETPWRQLTEEIKQVWNQHKEQEKGEALVDYMAETYFKPISIEQRYPLQFRMRTIMQVICVEQILKPYLQKRTWEEIYELPESFHWDQCEHWSELADLIVKYTKA